MALGLVVIQREEPRAGRATKYYRASARTYFVPVELITTTPGDGMNLRLRNRLAHSLAGSVAGYSYSLDAGRPRVRMVRRDRDVAPSDEIWLELRLSRSDAIALGEELRATFKRYAALAGPNAPGYIVHAALAPT